MIRDLLWPNIKTIGVEGCAATSHQTQQLLMDIKLGTLFSAFTCSYRSNQQLNPETDLGITAPLY